MSITSTKPNTTESSYTWFGSWPAFLVGNLQATCASTNVPLNTQFQTNNTAFSYVLKAVWAQDDTGRRTATGTLVYHNNPLQNCSIDYVQIQLEGAGRSASQIAAQQVGAAATAYTTCMMQTDQGLMVLELSTSYNFVPDDYSSGPPPAAFQGRNVTSKASLYFGESLLSMYWIQLTNAYFVANQDPDYNLYEGTITLSRGNNAPSTSDEVQSLGFFDEVSCYFVPFNATGFGVEHSMAFCATPTNITALSKGPGNNGSPLPRIWVPADSFSKIFYYTVLADLGQNNGSYSNILADQTLLEYYTHNFSAIARNASGAIYGENVAPDQGLAIYPYTTANNSSDYNLGINASTLAAEYLCQTPELKPAGTLVFAVLVSDLVLLQAIWKLFKLATDAILARKYPEMKYCEGCLERRRREEHPSSEARLSTSTEIPMLRVSRKDGGYGEVERTRSRSTSIGPLPFESDHTEHGYERIEQLETRSVRA